MLLAAACVATTAHADSVLSPPLTTGQAATNTVFTEEAARLRGKSAAFKTGDTLPPFVLYDQSSTPVQLPDAFAGKYIVVSFIFTRCQVATMCPAATSKMVQLQRSLDELGLGKSVQLVSITFDPRYDKPEVMNRYAQMFGAKTDNYAFLTGDEKLTNALLRRFGILTRDANDTIVHTMTTSLIAPDGTLALQVSGADWQPQTFLDHIRQHGNSALPEATAAAPHMQ